MTSNPEDEGMEEDSALQIILTAPLYFQSFQEYKRKELFTDLIIKCDGTNYATHSLIIAAASPPIFKLLRSYHARGCMSARCSEDEKAPGSQKHRLQKLQKFSSTALTLIDFMMIDPAKKVSRKEQRNCKKTRLSPPLKSKCNSRYCAARSGLNNASDGRFVVGSKEMRNSRIALAITVSVNGTPIIFIEGVDKEIMDLCIQLIYSESFRIRKRLIPKFISVARSLEILGSEDIYKELAMHLQDVPASIPLACEGTACAATVSNIASGEQSLTSENKSEDSTSEIILDQSVIDVQEGDIQELVDMTKCSSDRSNKKALKQKLPKRINLLPSKGSFFADEQRAVSLNLSAKDELCMYMDQINSANKCSSDASDNENVTIDFVTVDNSLIKEEDPLDIGEDNLTDQRMWSDVDENQTLQNLPISGQCESVYNTHISSSPDLQDNGLDKGSTSCQMQLCKSEKQALTCEVEVKDEPIDNLTTLSELRAFRFKSERKYVDNIEAVISDCNNSDNSGKKVEELKNEFPGKLHEHAAVVKKCEKKNFVESDVETRGNQKEGDTENKQTGAELDLFNNHSASNVELNNEMDLERNAKENTKITSSSKQKKNSASTVVSGITFFDNSDTQDKWQSNNDVNDSGITVLGNQNAQDKLQQNNDDNSNGITVLNNQSTQDKWQDNNDDDNSGIAVLDNLDTQDKCQQNNDDNSNGITVLNNQSTQDKWQDNNDDDNSGIAVLDNLDTQDKCQQNNDDNNREGIIPIECLDTRERLGVNQSAEARISDNADHELLVLNPENDERIDDIVCEEAILSENTIQNDFEVCVSGGNDCLDNGQQLTCKEGSSYDLNKESHSSNKDEHALGTVRVTHNSSFNEIGSKNSSDEITTPNMSKCLENPSSSAHPSQVTKLYMNYNAFKTSRTSVFKFQKTRREKEIAAYRRKILRSASSFHSKRRAKLSSSQRRYFKKGRKNITFQNPQISTFEKHQEAEENFTLMEGEEHSEHEYSLLSKERLPISSGQVSAIPSIEHVASRSEESMAATKETFMHHEGKLTETLKLKDCHEAGLKSSESLKEVNLSPEQRSPVTVPGKKSSVCAMSQYEVPDYSYAKFGTASAMLTEESENPVGSQKLKTDNENYDDLITNASWGSLAEEVEYVVVRDLAVTSKERVSCITERSETLECTTESFTVIRNHSILKLGEVSGSRERFSSIKSSKEYVMSDTNIKESENWADLENGMEMVQGTKQKQIADYSAVHNSESPEKEANALKDTFTDNWSFVTNSESLNSKSSKDTDVAAEFTVQVGDVSIKIQEYSKVKDEVYSQESVCRHVSNEPQSNKNLFSSCTRETNLTTEGTKQHTHKEEKTSKNPDFQEEKKDMNYIYECPCCQKTLESEELLLNHVLQSHKTYLCDYCPVPTCSVLLARNKFRIHLKQHLITNRYQCGFCSFSASMRGAMSRHESTHTKPQVSKDFKIMRKGYSKYRKSSKKQKQPPREELQLCSSDRNFDGEMDHGTRTVRVTRRSSLVGDEKLLLRRSSRMGMPECKKESKANIEEANNSQEEKELDFQEDVNKREAEDALSRALGDLAVEYSETEMLKDSVFDITSTSSCGSSIEPTIEQDLKVEGCKTGNQTFQGLPINCCSTLLSTVCELVDHIRKNHLSAAKGPGSAQKGLGSGFPCIDSNCPVSLKTTNLAVHLKSHLVPRKIACNLCTYTTNCEFALRTHSLAHNRMKGMKQKKRVLGSRRCVLKHRLRLRRHSLSEEKAIGNDNSSKVTQKKLPAQGINSKAVYQVRLPKKTEPSILKRKTKCLYLYQKKTKLTLQYLKLEREAKKLSDKVQKLDKDIKMVIQDPTQEEAEEVIPRQSIKKSAVVSVTSSSLLRKNILQNIGEQNALKNSLHISSEMSKNDKLKRKSGSIVVSCKEQTVASFENNHIKQKVKRQSSKGTKIKFESQLLSKMTDEGNKNNLVFSGGGKTCKTDLRSRITGEMHNTSAHTSIKCGRKANQAVEASNVCGSVIKPYFDYLGSEHSKDNDVAVDSSVKVGHTRGFRDNNSLDIAAPDVNSEISTNVYHQNFQEAGSGSSSLNSEGCLTGSANNELSQMTQNLARMSFLGTKTMDDLSSVRRSMQNAVKFNTNKSGTSSEEIDETEGQSTDLYECPLCSEHYQDPNTLVDHYTLFHSKHIPYVCKFKGCPAVLSRQNSLKHLESHLFKRNFDCPFCSYSHKSLYLLKHHLMVHREVSETLEENQQVMIHVRGKSGTGLINLLCQGASKSNKRKRRDSDTYERNSEY
ncbi:uncharacterized protein [Palaemon carinicauda]|uniref:uncharacterized protein n=1 Tax=Palaemon carinicauda TaxID=392227 RepID=UPI0035B570E4